MASNDSSNRDIRDVMGAIDRSVNDGNKKKIVVQTDNTELTFATYDERTKTWNTETRKGGHANLRGNNPGNITATSASKKMPGVIGTRVDPAGFEFLVFDSMENGDKAALNLLKTNDYQNAPANSALGCGKGTIGAAIAKWAPPSDNNTAKYIADLEKYTGMDKNTPMAGLSDKELKKVLTGIYHEEGNEPFKSTLGTITKGHPVFIEGVEVKDGNINVLKQKASEKRQFFIEQAKKRKASFTNGVLNNVFTDNKNIKTLSAEQIKAIINGTNFKQNILDHYDNPVYRIKIWTLSDYDMKNLSFTSIVDDSLFKDKHKWTIYDSARSTSYGVDDLQINSKIGANPYTKKVFITDFSFELFEPNGCLFFDRLKKTLKDLGYSDHKQTIFFLEVSFVGTYGPEHSKDPLGATIIGEKRIIPFIFTEVKSSINMSGARHKIRCASATHAIATSKDYFNFSKKIEIDQNVTSFKSVMQEVVNKLNECAQENILSDMVKSEKLPDGVVFKINFDDVPNDPKIDWNIVKNSGESSMWSSGKYTINPGTSIEKVLDDITCSLDTNVYLSVTNQDKVISPEEWPCLYRYEPSIRYCGQLPSTRQKIYEITYNIRRYYDTAMILSMPVDKKTQTTYINNLIQAVGSPLDKKYEFIFTSKNTQILKMDINLDMLWWVSTYDNIADRPADSSSCVSSQNQVRDAFIKSFKSEQAMVNGVELRGSGIIGRVIVPKQKWENEIKPNLPFSQQQQISVKDIGGIILHGDELYKEELLDLAVRVPVEGEGEEDYNMYDVCVLPGNFPYNESGMNQDATNRNDVKAKSSFDQLYKAGDMIVIKLTIKGDPYWLCNPVTDQYRSNAQFVFTMKTPAESNDSALNYLTTNTLWGIYDVIDIHHSFSKGVFTQELTAVANLNYRFPV